MVSLLANIGIMFMAVYFFYRSGISLPNQGSSKTFDYINCIFLEVLLGIVLIIFSTVIMGIRYDFRFLLFGFSAKYMDWKITSPAILLLGILRFAWGANDIAQMNFIGSVLLAVTLPMLVALTRNKLSDLNQLLVLVSFSHLPVIAITNHQIADKALVTVINLIFFACGLAATFGLHHVISDLKKLIVSASTDDLTGLMNVRTFNNDLMEAEREQKPVTLAIIDIDNFKHYNDDFGHDSGDAILKQIARVFNEQTAPDTVFYRVGGEEFAMIILDLNAGEAEEIVYNIQEAVAHTSFSIAKGDVKKITISVGVAHSRKGETLKKTFKRADVALYKAKRNGRNKVIVATPL